MVFLSVAEVRQLEAASWLTETSRALYATEHIHGFPWYTTTTSTGGSNSSANVPAVLRHVIPYDFVFKVFSKGRWVGRRLLSVYTEELSHHSAAYYEKCLRMGRLRCVSKKSIQQKRQSTSSSPSAQNSTQNIQRRLVKRQLGADDLAARAETPADSAAGGEASPEDPNVILQHGDIVLHTVHRHEVPVCLGASGIEPIQVFAVRIRHYGLLCVRKPTGLPTHAAGRYQYNSLLAMLEYVLAPKRLSAWLWDEDPLLQSLVHTAELSREEKEELWQYYKSDDTQQNDVDLNKAPRPCHRLDRVTSGVLLIGVSQSSTKRVGSALMNKSNDMNAAVQSALSRIVAPEQPSCDTTDMAEEIEAVLGTDYGVRKRYLARVSGDFPHDSPRLADALECSNSPSSHPHCADCFLVSSDALQRTVNKSLDCGVGDSDMNANGVLLASAVTNIIRPAEAPAEKQECDASGARKAISQSAATLCQRLRLTASETMRHSVLQCLPLTGRLHQIRIHLSDWAFPIEGDSEYAKPKEAVQEGAKPTLTSVFFSADQLPQSYRDYCILMKQQGGCPGVAEGDDMTSGEPLCYECAARLPIASFNPDGGSGAICLHAWQYELKEAMIREDGAPVEGLPNTTFCVCDGGTVRFTAPAPSWATD